MLYRPARSWGDAGLSTEKSKHSQLQSNCRNCSTSRTNDEDEKPECGLFMHLRPTASLPRLLLSNRSPGSGCLGEGNDTFTYGTVVPVGRQELESQWTHALTVALQDVHIARLRRLGFSDRLDLPGWMNDVDEANDLLDECGSVELGARVEEM